MSQLRWMLLIFVMLLSVGLDFVSSTLSVISDAVLIGAAIAILWPAWKNNQTKE